MSGVVPNSQLDGETHWEKQMAGYQTSEAIKGEPGKCLAGERGTLTRSKKHKIGQMRRISGTYSQTALWSERKQQG